MSHHMFYANYIFSSLDQSHNHKSYQILSISIHNSFLANLILRRLHNVTKSVTYITKDTRPQNIRMNLSAHVPIEELKGSRFNRAIFNYIVTHIFIYEVYYSVAD